MMDASKIGIWVATTALACAVTHTLVARAETIVIADEVKVVQSDVPRPARGMSMAKVEARFGAPRERHPTVGQPPITRWDYDRFAVFFEKDLVIDAVVTPSSSATAPTESLAGSAPAAPEPDVASSVPPVPSTPEPALTPPQVLPTAMQSTVAPPAVQPTVVAPTAVEPTVVEPPVVQPTAVQTTVVEPPAVQPSVVEPTGVQPTVVQPTAVASPAAGAPPAAGTATATGTVRAAGAAEPTTTAAPSAPRGTAGAAALPVF